MINDKLHGLIPYRAALKTAAFPGGRDWIFKGGNGYYDIQIIGDFRHGTGIHRSG